MIRGGLYVAGQVILVVTALMHSVITVITLATSPRIVQRKFPHQEHHATKIGHTPNHVMTTITGTDPSSFITHTAMVDASNGQDHMSNLTPAEVPATIRGTHPALQPSTTTAHDTHPPKDALGNTLTGTHCTGTTVTYP